MTSSGPPDTEGEYDPRAWLERELSTVSEVLDWICTRNGLYGDEADSLRSYAHLRLVEDDYRMIRAYSRRASPRTYLSAVLNNVFLDFRTKRWGKWRPSAAARHMGPVGILLDTLIHRDGHSRQEAVRLAASRDDVALSEKELAAVAAKLPHRPRRSFQRLDGVDAEQSARDIEDPLLAQEREATRSALERALEELGEQDRLILRLHFWEGLTIAGVARTLGLEQRPLYRKMDRLLKRLRAHLESMGLRWDEVLELMP